MSDQVSVTLKTLSDTMQLLSQSLGNEKKQHIELLTKLNNHLINSQTEIKQDIFDFINKVDLQEFALIVKDSKLNIENNQKSIVQLNAEIENIKQTATQSLVELEKQNLDISEKISASSDHVTSEIIKNVASNVKESVTQNFLLQFKEQNQILILEIEKANKTATTNILEIYNNLAKQVLSVTNNHKESISQFKVDVDAFKESINIAINSVKYSFAKVEELNADQMQQLRESCTNFKNFLINEINNEIKNINSFFDDEINKVSKKIKDHCESSLNKMSDAENLLNQKANQVALKLNESLTTTEKIIVKQTDYYEKLNNKLNFNYFSINTSSILFVLVVVLSSLCIATFIKNQQLVAKNQQLYEDSVILQTIKRDTLDITKLSIVDMKKKFPDLKVTFNCKLLD